MIDNPERERGILGKKDRQYLLGATEEQRKSSHGRVTRGRIRDRIYHGLLDMVLIQDKVEDRDRRTVFEELPEDRDLQRGVESALEFLYLAVEERDNEFENLLIPAVKRAERKISQGEIEDDVNVEISVDFEVETKLLLSDPDPTEYSDEEIGEMLADGRIDREDALDLLQARSESDED